MNVPYFDLDLSDLVALGKAEEGFIRAFDSVGEYKLFTRSDAQKLLRYSTIPKKALFISVYRESCFLLSVPFDYQLWYA